MRDSFLKIKIPETGKKLTEHVTQSDFKIYIYLQAYVVDLKYFIL